MRLVSVGMRPRSQTSWVKGSVSSLFPAPNGPRPRYAQHINHDNHDSFRSDPYAESSRQQIIQNSNLREQGIHARETSADLSFFPRGFRADRAINTVLRAFGSGFIG